MSYEPDRIFVGGLPPTCDCNEKLVAFFQQFGPVQEGKVFMDHSTGRSKGFGFVRFLNPESVEAAIHNDAKNIVEGKWVSVKRCEVGGAGGGNKWTGAQNSVEEAGLWVRGLPLDYTDSSLRVFFEQYGTVVDCKVLPRKYPNNPDQAGLVRMSSVEAAQWCCDNLNGGTPAGFACPLLVRRSNKSGAIGGQGGPQNQMGGGYGGGDWSGYGYPGAGGNWDYSQGLYNTATAVNQYQAPQAAWTGYETGTGTPGTMGTAPDEPPSNRLWVKGLPLNFNDTMLHEFFSQFGEVSDCKVLPQKYPQNPDLAAVVRMSDLATAQWCIDNLSGTQPAGFDVPISIKYARDTTGASGQAWGQQEPQNAKDFLGQAARLIIAAKQQKTQYPAHQQPQQHYYQQQQQQQQQQWGAPGAHTATQGTGTFEPDRIFVGGLPQSCDAETLALYFSQFGSVEEAVVHKDFTTGRSKGFGFVRFSNVQSVEMAVASSNNMIDGKMVAVKRCEVGGKDTGGAPKMDMTSLAGGTPGTGLWIGGLPLDFNDVALKALMEQYATVLECKVLPRKYPENPDQAGLVRLSTPEEAQWCIDTLNGTTPPGFPMPLTVKMSTSTAPPSRFDATAVTAYGVPTTAAGMESAVPSAAVPSFSTDPMLMAAAAMNPGMMGVATQMAPTEGSTSEAFPVPVPTDSTGWGKRPAEEEADGASIAKVLRS